MATLQIRVDDVLKKQADALFSSLGLDTSTAIRIFLNAAIENKGIPFLVQHKAISYSLQEAIYESRLRRSCFLYVGELTHVQNCLYQLHEKRY